uniref:TBC1 domain family member 15-like n=1 Tax=Ciona intestinalis TaxID=7719 RepID=UPI0002B8D0B8|nr:TBC1 domain family member 15-like [Ciona intestinalis]|eukprot:XP_018671423.1 TBC1 domain family member 15-like [Ciona intestinalis]
MSDKSFVFFKTKSTESFELVEAPYAIVDEAGAESRPYAVVDRRHARQESVDEDVKLVRLPSFAPLSPDEFASYFDVDGRVVMETKLRESIFHGGCDGAIRKKVWSFIFGVHPMLSTDSEREVLDVENHYKYHALKMRCLCYISEGGNTEQDVMSLKLPPPTNQSQFSDSTLENHANLAKIFAGNQEIDLCSGDWMKVINKDIPRTDTQHPYFKNQDSNFAEKMKNILITFGFYHPSIGYVQGMNDILTRFMVVMETEVEAYWSFTRYMEHVERDFDSNGMVEKLDLVRQLLKDLEPNLYSHLCDCSVEDLVFCHRWLLVSFKREFDYEESIRYFEMVHSQHLELDSLTAIHAQDEQLRLEVLRGEGSSPPTNPTLVDTKYTFEVFVCVAVIMLKRQQFLACKDAAEVFHIACNIRGTLVLQKVHAKAFALFFKYCRKSVSQQFVKVERPNILDAMSKLFKTKLF